MSIVRETLAVMCFVSAIAMGMASPAFAQEADDLVAAARQNPGQWVDPHNISDQLVNGPYVVDPNWPKPMSEWPGHEGWTWGAVQGVFAQNPDRIFVVMRGELPDLSNLTPRIIEVETDDGRMVHLQVPGRGMYARNASVGPYASPGEATDEFLGEEGIDYRWEHIIMVFDGEGNMTEDWTQWDSLFKPDDPKVLSQGRIHKIMISPYDPEKRVWAIDDGHHVIQVFSNDGKELLQTIGTFDTTTERNAIKTGNRGTPALTRQTGPSDQTFGRQTDIAWLPDGTFFVADGYEETRVVKFDKHGNFLMAWGEMGEAATAFLAVADDEDREPHLRAAALAMAGDALVINGNYTEAIGVFDELLKNYPSTRHLAGALLGKGQAKEDGRKESSALEFYTRALEENPDSRAAATGIVRILEPQGDMNAESLSLLGRGYLVLDRHDEAVAVLTESPDACATLLIFCCTSCEI